MIAARSGPGQRALAIVLVLAAGGASVLSDARLERLSAARPQGEELLYLPSGKHLEILSLGHASLLADLIYLWAIQYYADYERRDRYRYVEHVFGSVITELDPHYVDPYWVGSLILVIEAGNLEGGLRLLDRGFANNPDQWVLPYLAAWECYRAGQYLRAASYFARAAGAPGAPPVALRMRAGMVTKAGDLRGAIAMWREVLEDPKSDVASVAIAERQVRELQVRADIAGLEEALERFRTGNGRAPARLEELVERSYIRRLPLDPEGRAYAYDPRTGRVSSSAGRVLGGT